MRFRLRTRQVVACRWHGDHNKKDAFKEIEEAFGVSHRRGQIGKMLGGAIGVHDGIGRNGANAQPGQWFVRGVKDEMISMDDDLFQALFEEDPSECNRPEPALESVDEPAAAAATEAVGREWQRGLEDAMPGLHVCTTEDMDGYVALAPIEPPKRLKKPRKKPTKE